MLNRLALLGQVWAMRWRSRGGRLWNGALYAAAGAALVFLQV